MSRTSSGADDGRIGVVVIGRNEGERLRTCLRSVSSLRLGSPIIYVDSGSTDGSVLLAKESGADVVELDMTVPFTAARARNAGFQQLLTLYPQVEYVQFVDGDCELVSGWLDTAVNFMDAHADVAAVCGNRLERFPHETIYNLLCDIEWKGPKGNVVSCGGDSLMRVVPFQSVGGFRSDLIAGEEPELCIRLRLSGWQIWRIDTPMTWHDAAMVRFGQWWQRMVRAGHAFAQGAYIHGSQPERYGLRQVASSGFWGIAVPAVVCTLAIFLGVEMLWLFLVYPVQMARIALRGELSTRDNWIWAFFLVLGKFPEALGNLKFLLSEILGAQPRLIEYK